MPYLPMRPKYMYQSINQFTDLMTCIATHQHDYLELFLDLHPSIHSRLPPRVYLSLYLSSYPSIHLFPDTKSHNNEPNLGVKCKELLQQCLALRIADGRDGLNDGLFIGTHTCTYYIYLFIYRYIYIYIDTYIIYIYIYRYIYYIYIYYIHMYLYI